MKKVIDGAVYDTDTAKPLGTIESGEPGDFDYYEESLYATKSGKYFLHGDGGAQSKYSQETGENRWSGGEKIIPMSYGSATKWAEKNLDGDAYITAFGDPEGGTVTMPITMSSAARNKLEKMRAETGKNLSEIIEGLILQSDA